MKMCCIFELLMRDSRNDGLVVGERPCTRWTSSTYFKPHKPTQMKFNNVLTALISFSVFALIVFSFSTGHNKRVIKYNHDCRYYNCVVVDGRDTVAYDFMSYADFEYLVRTGSLR